MKSRLLFLWLVCALVVPTGVFAQSQATTGVIEGTVLDESGAVLPGVTVTLLNTATNFEQVLITDARGRFRGALLPLGPYRATAALAGFTTLVQQGIQLTIGRTIRLSMVLKISAVEEQILVTTEAPLIDTSRTEDSLRIDREIIENIPNNGRNFLEFTKLTPGVSIVQGPDGDELTINGQKGIQNNISVDGADFNNPFFGEQRGGQRPAFTFNIDAVQEFVVVTDGAPAEFGRSSSGFVNVVTKSGTNTLKGTSHLFFKNDSLSTNAERTDGASEPAFDSEQLQIGFTLGGPVKTDKTFFFVAVDWQQGDTTKQKDPSRIEQRVVDALAGLGSPNENAPIDRSNDALAFLGKVDWNVGSSNLLTLRYVFTDAEQANGTFDVDSWGASANAVEQAESNALTGSFISNVSGTLLNELRYQYAREDRPRPYGGPTFTGTDRPLPDTAFDFGRQYRFGMPFFIPVEYYDTRWQFNDNLSWLKGEHSFKVGIEYNETQAAQTFIGFANGRFIFGSTDGFLNYIANPNYVECSDGSSSQVGVCPAGTSITGPVLLYLQQAGVGGLSVEEAGTQTITQKEPAVFYQDTWQASDNFTLTYGLRWEAQIQPDPQTPPNEVFFADFIGQETFDGQRFPSNGEIPSDTDMWQPRLGFAWNPTGDGRQVLRGSLGLYYARIPGLALASSRSTNGSIGQTLFRNSALRDILGPTPAYDQLIPAGSVGDPFRPDVFVFDENFQNPRTTAASLTYERQIGTDMSLLLKYNYAKTDHLTRFINRNDAVFGSPWSTGLGPGGFNGVGALTTIESTARSKYEGYTIGFTKRAEKLTVQGFYTYSEDRSDDDNERDPFSFRYARADTLGPEYGFSDRDQKDRFNAWVMWRAPGGVDVNARFTYRSPQPLSLTENGTIAGSPQDRINADGSITQRNLGRKDNRFSSIDLRISKLFQAGGLEIEGIVEAFNLTNSKNLRNPQSTNLVFNFDGTVQSGLGDPRQLQLGVRVLW